MVGIKHNLKDAHSTDSIRVIIHSTPSRRKQNFEMNNNHDSGIDDNQVLKKVIYNSVNNDVNIQKVNPNVTKKNDTLFLYFSILTASTLMFVNGSSLVWTSPVIPQLKSKIPGVNPLEEIITTAQISMLAGIPSLFAVFGPLFFGKLADVIGRKNTLLCISLISLLSNAAVAFGSHIYVICVGRSIISLCMGLMFVVLPIYLNEICEDHNRAKHGCLMMFFLPLGSLYGYLLGSICNVKLFTLLCAAPLMLPLTFFLLFVPESPFYTANNQDKETTVEILKKLRSNKRFEEIEEDYIQIEITMRSHAKADVGGLKMFLEKRSLRMGLIIGLGSCMATQMTGVPVIMGFLGPIFNDAGTNMSGNTVAILVGSVKLIFFFATVIIVERIGRRPLLLFSSIGTGIPLAILTVYFYLHEINSPIVDNIKWLPIVCILVYMSFYSLGLGSIPYSVLSEWFPNDVRSFATSSILTIVNIFLFILTTTFPLVSEYFGVHYFIGMFSAGCLLSFAFIYFLLPETKGKSFLEIEAILGR